MMFRSSRVFRSIPTLALAIVACGGGGTSQVNSSPAASSAPSAASQSAAKGSCANPYLPAVNGATWTYAVTNNINGTSTSSWAISAVAASSFTINVKSPDVNWTETWGCNKDGLLQQQDSGGALAAAFSGPDGKVTISNLSTTGVTVPLAMKPGDSWTQTTDYSLSSTVGVSGKSTTTWSYKAVRFESVTVPAGTFDALRVDLLIDGSFTYQDGKVLKTTTTGASWWVKGKGQAKSTQSTGVAASTVSFEAVLQTYQIP
jgi:hypothetical protein